MARRLPIEIERVNQRRAVFSDLYHFLVNSSWRRLFAAITIFYLTANLTFAFLYHLGGNCIENVGPHDFPGLFFFSVQTMATIGYGVMAPKTNYAHSLVTVQALLGTILTAMFTGLVFAKFSRPTARVMWTSRCVITLREGVPALMVRMANERTNQIVEAVLHLVFVRRERSSDGEELRRFYDLKLVRERNAIFVYTWTAIHLITPDSPLYGMSPADMKDAQVQLVCSLIGLDETFAQTVHSRAYYGFADIAWDMRFVDILLSRGSGTRYIDYARFDDVEPAHVTGVAEHMRLNGNG